MTDTRRNIRLTVFIICIFMAAVVGLFVHKQMTQPSMTIEQLRDHDVFMFDHPRIIKPFTLVDDNGKPFTKERLKGHWTLVYFGFTFCPDVCPTTMAMLNKMVSGIQDPAIRDSTEVVMVSVDPGRDTPDKMNSYVHYFNKDFTGVTGEFLKVHAFATNLNAAFQKVPGGGESYAVDHSAYVFLVNPKGDYHGFFKPPFEPEKFRQYYKAVRELFPDL